MRSPQTVLQNRFRLNRKLHDDQHSQTWLAVDTHEDQPTEQICIVRLWPFYADRSDESAKVLWSREERRMRRLAGTAGVDESLMTLLLSGREEPSGQDTWYLVMVLKSNSTGYTPLAVEAGRPASWLRPADLKVASHRALIWEGLSRVAFGIQLLHRQRILHRNVSLETIFWDSSLQNAPSSMRLGGFETSLRFGMEDATNTPLTGESGQYAATFPMDWFRLGVVLASVFGSTPISLSTSVHEQILACENAVSRQGNLRLTPRERDLIVRLLGYGSDDRVVSGETVVAEFKKVVESLQKDAAKLEPGRPLALVFNPMNERLLGACRKAGFVSDVDVSLPLSQRDIVQQAELRAFIRQNLVNSRLYREKNGNDGLQRCVLVSDRLRLLIISYVPRDTPSPNRWDKAFIIGPTDLRDGAQPMEDLKDIIVEPLPLTEADRYQLGQSWKPILPSLPSDRQDANAHHGIRIHHFLRSTNLLDLLLTSARIFPYETLESTTNSQGVERIVIREVTRATQLPEWTKVKDGLAGDLTNEIESQKTNCDLVLLTSNDELHVKDVDRDDWWRIEDIGASDFGDSNLFRKITLTRLRKSNPMPAPPNGFIRSFNLFGLFTLIARRKRAIDKMKDNTLLLRVMDLSDSGVIHTTAEHMAFSNELLDGDLFLSHPSRKCFFEDVDRVRPLYVLQGPPGTGKSTFVAKHLRRILDKSREPYAQILVTAQAHAGVDVLRSKVADAFDDLSERQKPLSIRLGERRYDKDSIQNVSARCLRESLKGLNSSEMPLDPLQLVWRAALEGAEQELCEASEVHDERDEKYQESESAGTLLRGMMQLIKRCASISYCTASAKDLAELAKESDFDNSYDLVIVEEAGKIHAFDLVLPMSAGYSWLLLGDHKQLPAFQIDNFERGLRGMDGAVAALRLLPASSYIDTDWLGTWENWSGEERERQTNASVNVLRYFKWLHESIGGVGGDCATGGAKVVGDLATRNDEAQFTGAGMLSDQFRMPPTLCKLISDAFYDGILTTGSAPRNPCSIKLNLESGTLDLSRYPIVWIDTPWCQKDSRFGEDERIRVNQREARVIQTLMDRLEGTPADKENPLSLSVLTPYRRQLGRLLEVVGWHPSPPAGCKFKASVNSKDGREQWAHTVDSFQGNEADIVITSLVRNNPGTGDIARSLGFLADPERMNVLLSRAIKMLIIVGSREFFRAQLDMRRVEMGTKHHELWFLRSVMDQLDGFYRDGTALHLLSTDVTPVFSP